MGSAAARILPKKLGKDPIREAVFEIRFNASTDAASDVITGALYKDLKPSLTGPERLPFVSLPQELVANNPSLRYQPRIRLQGVGSTIMIGDHSVIIACQQPYPGWGAFKARILEVVNSLKGLDIVESIERFSVKYVNLIQELSLQAQFMAVDLSARMGTYKLTEHLTQFRTEIEKDGFTNIIEIVPDVMLNPGQQEARALLLTIDTIHKEPTNFWNDSERMIDSIHDAEKSFFFEILTADTVAKCEPSYE